MADFPLLIHSDLELFLVPWYQAWFDGRPEDVCSDVVVVNDEPDEDATFPKKLFVIHDLGGPDTSIMTAERAVGLSALAGTKRNPKDANDLIRFGLAAASQIPVGGNFTPGIEHRNPVSALLESNGPFPVDEEQDRARRYATITLGVTPTLL